MKVLSALTIALVALVANTQAYAYDGKDPNATGCGRDARTVRSAKVCGGTVELRYSLKCHTAWARVTGLKYVPSEYGSGGAKVVRNNDGRSYSCKKKKGNNSCYTAMVYDKGMTSYAWGEEDNGSTCWKGVRTGSY